MSVILRKKKNATGTTSLYLEIYHNGIRKYEFLKHLKLKKGTSPLIKEENRTSLETAKKIAISTANELEKSNYNLTSDIGKKTYCIAWFQSYVENYKLKDKRNMQGALNKFINFLHADDLQNITFSQLNENIITDFRNYLNAISKGEGGASYFARFKKMVKRAYKEGLMVTNPAEDVKIIKHDASKKDILSIAEIQAIAHTPCASKDVKNAFLFSCMTGLRWCDVKALKWTAIDLKEGKLKQLQGKTKKEVFQNLNKTAKAILELQDKNNELVFSLPSANGANKTIGKLVQRAGIDKKIRWHNARHSFGTNLILNETEVLTVSKMLGHSTLAHTQRYVTVAEEMKQKASEKLNFDL